MLLYPICQSNNYLRNGITIQVNPSDNYYKVYTNNEFYGRITKLNGEKCSSICNR